MQTSLEQAEREICDYLKTLPGQYVSAREIARRAGGKSRFHEDPNWASPVITQLVEKKMIESDSTGHYRLPIKDDRKNKKSKWVSPQMKSILEKSGKDFTHVIPDEDVPQD